MVADAIPYSNFIMGLIITGVIVYMSTIFVLRRWQQSIGSAFLVTLMGYIVYIVINTFISNTSRDALLFKTGIEFIAWLYLVKKCYCNVDWFDSFLVALFATILMFLPSAFLPMFFRI
jgi:cell shape-determining protein MreD